MVLNAKEQKGNIGVSSFETVYEFKHHDHDGMESFDEMRKCRTVAKGLALLSKHTDFFKMMRSNNDWVYMNTEGNPHWG